MENKTSTTHEKTLCAIPRVGNCPSELEPVLAKIEHINELGLSSWYEVVYFDGHWRCYDGSSTFKDGEKVVKWRYCEDCCQRTGIKNRFNVFYTVLYFSFL